MGTRCHSQVSFPVWFSYPCLTSASRFPRRAPATCGRPFLPFCSDYSHPCPPLASRLEKESAPGAHGNMIERSHAELTDGGVRIDLCFYLMSLSLFQVCAQWKLRRFHFQWCPHAKRGQYFHSDVKATDYICASRRDVSPLLSGEFLGNACERMNAALFFFHRAKKESHLKTPHCYYVLYVLISRLW